jgi:exodeoxyribonuclease VII large subunit
VNPSSTSQGLPRYSVAELNGAIGTLLERGFAPRFLLEGTVSRPQRKKGHLWLTLTDGEATISAVVWASQLQKLSYLPEEGDGVLVVGKLNFWSARATLCVQVLDLRPGLTTVLRVFEQVKAELEPEGLFDPSRKRPLPVWPQRIALLTSVPSSAMADMLRTAKERWPATSILLVPVPVQGAAERQLCACVEAVGSQAPALGLEAVVLARGGGSREDLALFDSAALARCLASCPVPVVCGLGHEDDTTIADLVSDYSAATPTAALVALLPDRRNVLQALQQSRIHLRQLVRLKLNGSHQRLISIRQSLRSWHPKAQVERQRRHLHQHRRVMEALSPQRVLARGFALVRTPSGGVIHAADQLRRGDRIHIELATGMVTAQVEETTGKSPQVPTTPRATTPDQQHHDQLPDTQPRTPIPNP